MSYVVNGQVFKTKTALRDYAREILNGTLSEVSEDHLPFLIELFRRHQDTREKFGDGIKTIRVIRAKPYNTRCFEIERIDGSRTDISYLECLLASDARDWFAAACRSAVVSQIQAFKSAQFEDRNVLFCPITEEPITPDTCHVDHAPPNTFRYIVDSFIGHEGIRVERVKYTDGDGHTACRFVEGDMHEAFAEWHRERAQLRVVSKRANLSLLRRAR